MIGGNNHGKMTSRICSQTNDIRRGEERASASDLGPTENQAIKGAVCAENRDRIASWLVVNSMG